MKNITIAVLLFLPCFLISQDQIMIDLRDRSITINSGVSYEYLRIDSSYNYYNHNHWGGKVKKDTFLNVVKEVRRRKNIIGVVPRLHGTTYKLYRQLIGKSWSEKDSILNTFIQKEYKWIPSASYRRVSYEVTSIQYYQTKYPYIDIYETKYQNYKGKKLYNSEITRVFLVGEVKYYIYILNNDLETTTSILKSRKAVCHDFKRLVNNITIIEKEEPSPSK